MYIVCYEALKNGTLVFINLDADAKGLSPPLAAAAPLVDTAAPLVDTENVTTTPF